MSDGYDFTFNGVGVNLPIASATFTTKGDSLFDWFPPFDPSTMKYDILIGGKDNPRAKCTIGYDDTQRLANGETIDVDWYHMIDGQWEFLQAGWFRIGTKKESEE